MAKIPLFDAGSGKLEVDQSGAEALSRAGMMGARYASQTAEVMKQTGQLYKQGIDSVGKGLEDYTKTAQEHTDAMAETEADAQIIQNKFAAQGIVSDAGTPKDGTTGEPITNHVGIGGEQGLPPDAKVPTTDEFASAAGATIAQHQAAGQNLLDRLDGQGVSDKMQQHITQKVMNAHAELQLHAAAVANENATTRIVHQTDTSLRALETNTNQTPNNLDDNLKQGHDIYTTLTGHGTGDAAKQLNDLAVKGEEDFRERTIRGAYEGIARKGGDAAIAEATKVMDAHSGDVKDRQAGLNEITRLANQQNANLERQQRQEEREQAIKIDGASATAFENSKLPSTDPKSIKDPLAEVRKQFHGNDLIAAEKEIKTLQLDSTNPVDKETSSATEMDIQKRIDDGSLTRANGEKEVQDAWHNRQIDRQGAQRAIRSLAASETSDGKFVKEQRTAFLKQYESVFNGPKMASGFFASEEGAGKARIDAIKLENTVGPDGKTLGRSIYDQDSPNYIGRKPDGTPSQFMTDHKMGMQQKIQQGLDNAGLNQKPAAPGATPTGDPLNLGRTGGPTAAPLDAKNIQGASFGDLMSASVSDAGKGALIDKAFKAYLPGQQILVPDPKNAGQQIVLTIPPAGTTITAYGAQHTVPGTLANTKPPMEGATPKKMNYDPGAQHTPFGVGTPNAPMGAAAGGAIKASTLDGLDAHTGKNLFSSGRAAQLGISGGEGQNLVSIGKNPADGTDVKVNAQAAPHFQAFLEDLKGRGYQVNSLGGYADRDKRGGSSKSEHAFGNAIDINPGKNEFHGPKTNLPSNIGAIAAQYGLIWGGNWSGGSRDNMHFEWSGKS